MPLDRQAWTELAREEEGGTVAEEELRRVDRQPRVEAL